jgi:glycosyltransferase involved in cell wall biosynthesis
LALAQDYPHLEIVISDNASTDDTGAIARQYPERDPRIRHWRNQTDLGVVGNFGRVLEEAQGQYFTWLASDDILSSRNYVTRTVTYLEANPDVGICSCDFHILDLAGPSSSRTDGGHWIASPLP